MSARSSTEARSNSPPATALKRARSGVAVTRGARLTVRSRKALDRAVLFDQSALNSIDHGDRGERGEGLPAEGWNRGHRGRGDCRWRTRRRSATGAVVLAPRAVLRRHGAAAG